MKNLKILICCLILFFYPLSAVSDTIILKNGQRIKNVTVWEEGSLIKCYRFGSVIGYSKDNIEKIEKENIKSSTLKQEIIQPDYAQASNLNKNPETQFYVVKVYDGDSFKATNNNIEIMVRFAGIDAPETAKKKSPGQPYSQKAKKYLADMILNKTVTIKGYGIGGYGRQLAEIFVENKNVGLLLIGQGLAEMYHGKLPKGFDSEPYKKAEIYAKNSRKGIWSLEKKYISPKKWRKMYKP